jgi:hypothetical protein
MNEEALRKLFSGIDPAGRNVLRRLMRADQADRDEFAAALLRLDTPSSRDLATLIDLASLNPDLRRMAARLLGELEAASHD